MSKVAWTESALPPAAVKKPLPPCAADGGDGKRACARRDLARSLAGSRESTLAAHDRRRRLRAPRDAEGEREGDEGGHQRQAAGRGAKTGC
jgi:hypothetical protein